MMKTFLALALMTLSVTSYAKKCGIAIPEAKLACSSIGPQPDFYSIAYGPGANSLQNVKDAKASAKEHVKKIGSYMKALQSNISCSL